MKELTNKSKQSKHDSVRGIFPRSVDTHHAECINACWEIPMKELTNKSKQSKHDSVREIFPRSVDTHHAECINACWEISRNINEGTHEQIKAIKT
jgi:tRNA A37 threonylcarbamoyltransferase TsaD